MKIQRKNFLLTAFLVIIFSAGLTAYAQSRDSENPTLLTGTEISGRVSGSGTVYYAFDVLRNERIAVELRLTHSEGISFALDFRDSAAGTLGREGDLTYYSVDNGASGTETINGSFTTTRRQRVLLLINNSGPGSYNVRLTRSGGLDDTLIAKEPTQNVPSLPKCVDLKATSITFRFVPASESRTGKPGLWVDGLVANISPFEFRSSEGLQSLQLYEKGFGGVFFLVKDYEFTNLAVGEDVLVKYDRIYTEADKRTPPTFRLKIKYAEGIRTDGNPENDDCISTNDLIVRTANFKNLEK
jgi:hypothetical protein